jgi:hypothetical protein
MLPTEKIDITYALKRLQDLKYSGGDLDALYWSDIAELLKWANEKRNSEIQISMDKELKRAQRRAVKPGMNIAELLKRANENP